MKRSLIAILVLVASAAVLAAALIGFRLMQSGGDSPAYAAGPTVSLDMDADNGTAPCDPIDASANHLLGSTYHVAVCVQDLYIGNPMGVLAFDILYDDTLNTAPEVADVGQGLDDNPNLNDGEYGDGVGSGWDCSGGGAAYPKGDKNLATGPGNGDAFLSCRSSLGPWTLGDDETAGVIEVVTFVAGDTASTDTLVISTGLLGYTDATEMGTCNPVVAVEMTCVNGTDNKVTPPPQCDIADMGITAVPASVAMKIGEVRTVNITETIKNLGHTVAGAPDAVCMAQAGLYLFNGDATPIDTTAINPRLEPNGGDPENPLDGDACILGVPPTFTYIACDEDQGPIPLSNNTGSCVNTYDDDADGTCDWGPVNALCGDPGTGADPECVDIQSLIITPLYVPVLEPPTGPGTYPGPTATEWTWSRDLEIHCKKVGNYTLMALGVHKVPKQCDAGDAVDDDNDGKVNDGCPIVGTAETGTQCDNAVDDDGDGYINDGCPIEGSSAEFSWPYGYDPVDSNNQSPAIIQVSCQGLAVAMEKDADVLTEGVQDSNTLFLMDPALSDAYVCDEGKGCLSIDVVVSNVNDIDDSNDSDTDPECLGAWEHQIKYEHKLLSLTENDLLPGDPAWIESEGRIANCTATVLTENYLYEGCTTQDDPEVPGIQVGPCGDGLLETIKVMPRTDDLMFRDGFRPTKDNGVVTDLVDENCEITDIYAEPMTGLLAGGLTPVCGDAHIAIRMLEGDLDLDCDVDVTDDQAIAFRYGSFFGLLLYDQWYDLEPNVADYDIDIKDLQFVFGRNWSTCQAPIPDDQDDPVVTAQP
jgi:hypothetical protein